MIWSALPKAHLHLHLTGAMRHSTMVELARAHGVSLPSALTEEWPPQLSTADERGWFRFQRLYDTARSVLRTPDDLCRLVREIAEDERAEGSGWLELQADPSGFASMYGGITAFTELLLDAAEKAARAADIGIGIIIAANRTRHPMDARTLARLAAQYAGQGVIGFGLSNDERRGPAADFAPAFRIAERAGLLLAPHAGELVGPASVTAALDLLHANRLGHGVRSVEDPRLVERLAARAGHLRGLPVLQRVARRRTRRGRRAGQDAVRGRGPGGARRGRPAAVRPAPGQAVRDRPRRPRLHAGRAGRARPHVGPRLRRAARHPGPPAVRHRRLAGRPRSQYADPVQAAAPTFATIAPEMPR